MDKTPPQLTALSGEDHWKWRLTVKYSHDPPARSFIYLREDTPPLEVNSPTE